MFNLNPFAIYRKSAQQQHEITSLKRRLHEREQECRGVDADNDRLIDELQTGRRAKTALMDERRKESKGAEEKINSLSAQLSEQINLVTAYANEATTSDATISTWKVHAQKQQNRVEALREKLDKIKAARRKDQADLLFELLLDIRHGYIIQDGLKDDPRWQEITRY